MQKRYLISLILLIVAFTSGAYMAYRIYKEKTAMPVYSGFTISDYTVDGKKYQLLIADSDTKWSQGLMFYRSLEGVDGMIFVFPDKRMRTFYNKNTFMDLTLLWLDGKRVVGTAQLPSIEKSKDIVYVNSPEQVTTVIELVNR